MNNHEKYRQAFACIQVICPVVLEKKTIYSSPRKLGTFMRPALAMSIAAAAPGGSRAAYAADFGGMCTITSWLSGKEHTFEAEETRQGYRFTDVQNKTVMTISGGTLFDENGKIVQPSFEQLAAVNALFVEQMDDGKILLFWQDASFDLTSLPEHGNHVDVKFEAQRKVHYVSIDREGSSFAFSLQE